MDGDGAATVTPRCGGVHDHPSDPRAAAAFRAADPPDPRAAAAFRAAGARLAVRYMEFHRSAEYAAPGAARMAALPDIRELNAKYEGHIEDVRYSQPETFRAARAYIELAITILRDLSDDGALLTEEQDREDAITILRHVRCWINETEITEFLAPEKAMRRAAARGAAA